MTRQDHDASLSMRQVPSGIHPELWTIVTSLIFIAIALALFFGVLYWRGDGTVETGEGGERQSGDGIGSEPSASKIDALPSQGILVDWQITEEAYRG